MERTSIEERLDVSELKGMSKLDGNPTLEKTVELVPDIGVNVDIEVIGSL